jgi:acyl-CoA-dependent ceramide synthase
MRGPLSATAEVQSEKIRTEALDPLPLESDILNRIGQKHNGDTSVRFTPRTTITKKKAKRKDDGPLEIVCGWVVEHQLGILRSSPSIPLSH